MRFPSLPTLIRAFSTLTNTTSTFVRSNSLTRTLYTPPHRAIIYRSMPNIPFLSSFFGSTAAMPDTTVYPVSKPEGEWQAEMSPGTSLLSAYHHHSRALTNTLS